MKKNNKNAWIMNENDKNNNNESFEAQGYSPYFSPTNICKVRSVAGPVLFWPNAVLEKSDPDFLCVKL